MLMCSVYTTKCGVHSPHTPALGPFLSILWDCILQNICWETLIWSKSFVLDTKVYIVKSYWTQNTCSCLPGFSWISCSFCHLPRPQSHQPRWWGHKMVVSSLPGAAALPPSPGGLADIVLNWSESHLMCRGKFTQNSESAKKLDS